jgi:putative transcriptional regulator
LKGEISMIQERITDQQEIHTTETTDEWASMMAMTEEERHQAAMSDPDAIPMTEEELHKAPRMPYIKGVRRALGLTQEEFARRYGIPVGTLRDWEQGRVIPDLPTRSYLFAIARGPEIVYRLLSSRPQD